LKLEDEKTAHARTLDKSHLSKKFPQFRTFYSQLRSKPASAALALTAPAPDTESAFVFPKPYLWFPFLWSQKHGFIFIFFTAFRRVTP
jgi:hypothetical protein